MRRPNLSPPDVTLAFPQGLNPFTARLVHEFALALAGKLRSAETKYDYAAGWLTEDWERECRQHLLEHIAKGDPLDVAAYAAFMWRRGWSTADAVSHSTEVRRVDDPA